MKKILIKLFVCFIAFVFSGIHHDALAQTNCPPCPSSLMITDTNSCENFVQVFYPNYTNVNSQSSHFLKVCKNAQMKYLVTPGFNPQLSCNYNILPSIINVVGGTLVGTSLNSFTIQWGSSNYGSVEFNLQTGNDSISCAFNAKIYFELIDNPIASFVATPQPACYGNPTSIAFNSNATQNATNYFWTFGDGYTHVGPNPMHNYALPGTYQVCLYTTNFVAAGSTGAIGPPCPTCKDSICHTIVIDALPPPPIECVATVCAGKTATYSTTATGCSSYIWSVVGGTITGGQGTPNVTVLWGNGNPQGSVSLLTTGCTTSYCTQGNTVLVPIVGNSFPISGDTLVCEGVTETYTVPTLPATNYSWTVSSPASISPFNTNTSSVNVAWTTPGDYVLQVSYYDSTLHCGGDTSIIVHVRPKLLINGKTTVCIGNSILLKSAYLNPSNVSIPAPSNWIVSPSVGLNITSGNGTSNATFLGATVGTYTVTATSTNASPLVCNNATFVVQVKPLPILSPIIGNDFICPNENYVYASSSSQVGLFTWVVTGGSFIPLSANADSVQITWNPIGPYSISLAQLSYGDSCVSATVTKTILPYPTPSITGNVIACVDDTLTYVITGIPSGFFNWSVSPSNLGTVISGQGTSTAQIKWHGDTTSSTSLTAYLHYGVCGSDSILITINKPPLITINGVGTLCGSGINLSSTATSGTYLWSAIAQPILPSQPINLATINGLYSPGNYQVQIQNANNTGCKVIANYQIPDIGRPDAQIYTLGSTHYCLPSLPNMVLNALSGAGYTYQWYMNGTPIGTNTDTLQVNTGLVAIAGNYSFTCVVSVGLCKDTSSPILIIVETCLPTVGCIGLFDIMSISNCNPFNITLNPTFPLGATLSGPTILHYDDNSIIAGLTTKNYTTIGLKPFRVCAMVNGPGANCVYCKDTFATVSLAANFLSVEHCGSVTLTDLSTVIPPAIITSYAWSVTDIANLPVPPIIASFNNSSIANPLLNITQSGSYIITQTVSSSNGCVAIHKDTVIVNLASANFTVNDTCANKTITISNVNVATSHYWDFGDASTSLTNPTSHAYSVSNTYMITHIATNDVGCKDTVSIPVNIFPNPTCTISYVGSTTICQGDSLKLTACAGFTNYQWYKNGNSISGANAMVYFARQTGDYTFTASTPQGCIVTSDTVSLVTKQLASTTFLTSGKFCDQSIITIGVPKTDSTVYLWFVDNVLEPTWTLESFTTYAGTGLFPVGSHWVKVMAIHNGCLAIDSILITINPMPSVTISVVGPSPICSNNLYTFSATTSANSPIWNWNLGVISLGNTNSINASSAGTYNVLVTDGITGCTNIATESIMPSPDLSLFPIGCDIVCDTSKVNLPIPTLNFDLSNYASINWYKVPNLVTSIGSGITLPLNAVPLGSHGLAAIVIAQNGCADTSTVYNVTTVPCNFPLEIGSISLSAIAETNANILQWKTIHEQNISHFDLEKSRDGIAFEKIAKVYSKGNSDGGHDYKLIDEDIRIGIDYYRIKVTDYDSKSTYSKVVVVDRKVNQLESDLNVYPNPSDGKVYFSQSCFVTIIDMTGKVMLQKANTSQIDITSFPKGLYFIRLRDEGNKLIFTSKLIKK